MTKGFLDWRDIAERYGVSKCNAYALIRAVKAVSVPPGLGALGRGKILPSELERWEQMFGRELTDVEKQNINRAKGTENK